MRCSSDMDLIARTVVDPRLLLFLVIVRRFVYSLDVDVLGRSAAAGPRRHGRLRALANSGKSRRCLGCLLRGGAVPGCTVRAVAAGCDCWLCGFVTFFALSQLWARCHPGFG